MKFLSEFQDKKISRRILDEIDHDFGVTRGADNSNSFHELITSAGYIFSSRFLPVSTRARPGISGRIMETSFCLLSLESLAAVRS